MLPRFEVVARRLHPERKDPLLQFTVPEALAVIERASSGLRDFVTTSFPLGDRITVAQLMWLYRWRGALNVIEKGHYAPSLDLAFRIARVFGLTLEEIFDPDVPDDVEPR